jgi:hypothetical protein
VRKLFANTYAVSGNYDPKIKKTGHGLVRTPERKKGADSNHMNRVCPEF